MHELAPQCKASRGRDGGGQLDESVVGVLKVCQEVDIARRELPLV